MTKKTKALSFLIIIIGIVCTAIGSFILAENVKTKNQAERFEALIYLSQDAVLNQRYQNFPGIISSWNKEKHFKSVYNQGWMNLHLFKDTNDEGAYRAARANLRESLRQEPSFFDAKHNLIYLDNLAVEKGINLEEIPISSDNAQNDLKKGLDEGFNTDKNAKDLSRDLRKKITNVSNAPGLGGEPFDPDDVPDDSKKIESPPNDY